MSDFLVYSRLPAEPRNGLDIIGNALGHKKNAL